MKGIILFSFLLLSTLGIASEVENKQPQPTSPEVIVFDFGGVVGGTDQALVSQEVSVRLGIPLEEAASLVKQMSEIKKEGISHPQFWQAYATKTGRQLPEDWDRFIEEAKCRSIRANPAMLSLAKSLRNHGYRVAMFSDTTPERAAFIRNSGYYEPFDPVVLSYEIHLSKPDPKAFGFLTHQLNVPPERCLFIDNSPANIDEAKKLGFDAILFNSVDDLKSQLKKRNIPTE